MRGEVQYFGPRPGSVTRAITAEPALLRNALAEAGLEDRHTLVVRAPTPRVPEAAALTRSGRPAPDEILLEVPAARDESQFLIYQDEDGVLSLHFPELVSGGKKLTTRAVTAPRLYQYRVKLRAPRGLKQSAEGKLVTRGPAGVVLGKILKVVARKAGIGLATWAAVKAWELTFRKFQGFHSGPVDSLLADNPANFGDWKKLHGEKSLLFIHGTTSTTAGAFAALKGFSGVTQLLYQHYAGRVIGFNHHTMAKSVARNIAEFYEGLTVPGEYHFDVICHSRGGLLARALAELTDNEIGSLLGDKKWKHPAGVCVSFDRIVFVATPNIGTDLADTRNLPVVLDRIANVINFLPDSAITLGMGGFFSVASDVAAMGLRELVGLADQSPQSKFLKLLNSARASSPPGNCYFALRSNYTPDGGLVKALLDKGVDSLFQGKENDLIVPTLGVSETPEFSLPNGQVKTYGADTPDNVPHTGFFQREETWRHIKKCLAIP